MKSNKVVIALAGRRIDAAGAQPSRFDPAPRNIERVGSDLRSLFVSAGALALVSSAACGADLLALEEAAQLGMRRKIILPCDPAQFRATSVIDRPGNWGAIYDKVIDDARRKGDLTVLHQKCSESSYLLANHVLIDEAIALGAQLECTVCALSVWEGETRGPEDLTAEFRSYATIKKVPLLKDILTIARPENS